MLFQLAKARFAMMAYEYIYLGEYIHCYICYDVNMNICRFDAPARGPDDKAALARAIRSILKVALDRRYVAGQRRLVEAPLAERIHPRVEWLSVKENRRATSSSPSGGNLK
jgi:hypothetical protein